ncbi:MAG TPA: peptidylprolyl isomerase, partial [Polyangiaceae bacterium]|nr:peptidylprolyl isomerase [Polyangiaceae bacterium]
MNRVVLRASHILIRHESSDREVPFLGAGWNVEPAPPGRGRAEALALAEEVAARASATPDAFDALARQYSEDLVTRDDGGSLGGLTAAALLTDAAVLDALAATPPGAVSRVVATRHGYHILRRGSPPAPAVLSARRIVVPYDTTSPGGRSRARAEAIARDVAATLRASRAEFDRLLRQYPSPDDFGDGDVGVWTTQEPGPLERERERIARMQVGEVSDPIEGRAGFQVFVRTPVPPDRVEYGARAVRIAFAADAPADSPHSPEHARTLAETLEQ